MPKLNFSLLRKTLLYVFAFAVIFTAGYYVGLKGIQVSLKNNVTISRELPPDKQNVNFSLFWKVWDLINSTYFDKTKIDPAKMVYGAISGMVDSLGDPYTSFLPPTQNKVVDEDLSGSFEGVGIEIGFKGTQLAVQAPLPGSPAEKAGVKPGDLIVGIKDVAKKLDIGTVGINLVDAVQDIRGPAGTKVTLALMREGETKPIIVEVVRQKIDVPSVTVEFLNNDTIAHIRVLKFDAQTNGEWDNIVKEVMDKKSVKGIVLDLRNNPGGYLDSAVYLAGEFLPNGSVVVTEDRGNGAKTDYKVTRFGLLNHMPVDVLINGGSASASEILSGALRDDAKVKLVGDTSFGKGTIQEPMELDNGAGIHITIARWLTPSGYWVHGKGLAPDVQVKDDDKTPQDEQLDSAVKLLAQ